MHLNQGPRKDWEQAMSHCANSTLQGEGDTNHKEEGKGDEDFLARSQAQAKKGRAQIPLRWVGLIQGARSERERLSQGEQALDLQWRLQTVH